ncbi:MAG: hypothetical protein M3238_06975, partial [Actinomycetota bacterium]|nr:hypothetical protein [Actinomycetota bacterium]
MDKGATGTTRPALVIALACAVISIAVAGTAVVGALRVSDGDPTVLVHMSGEEPLAQLARQIDPGFHFVSPDAHYDGVYFYAIALDPLAR